MKTVFTSQERKQLLVSIVITAFYFLLCLFMIFLHENWRDEAQAWMIAKSLSPLEIFRQMKYEGHPCAWHLLLWPFAQLGFPYYTMNLISAALVSAAVFFLLWKAPMHPTLKLFSICSAAVWYHYAVIARSYAFIPILLFLMAYYYEQRHSKPFAYCLCLAGMVQTHVYMLPMTGIASLFFMSEVFSRFRKDRDLHSLARKGFALTLPLLSLVLFILQIVGFSESSAFAPKQFRLGEIFGQLIETFANYWGDFPRSKLFLSCLFLLFSLCYLVFLGKDRKKHELAVYAIALSGILCQLLFSVFIYHFSVQRYFLWLFIWLWLLWLCHPGKQQYRPYSLLVACFLLLSLPAYRSAEIALYDIRHSYSGAKECAYFINDVVPQDALILQAGNPCSTSIYPYLQPERVIYSTESGRYDPFVTWGTGEPVMQTPDDIRSWVRDHFPEYSEFWLIVPTDNSVEGLIQWCYNDPGSNPVFTSFGRLNEDYTVCRLSPLS